MNAGFNAQVDKSTMTVKLVNIVYGGIGQYPVRAFLDWHMIWVLNIGVKLSTVVCRFLSWAYFTREGA